MTRDDDRRAILARRRFFVASALAGLASAQCDNPFRPCLEVAPLPHSEAGSAPQSATAPPRADAEAPPQPCLEVMPTPESDAAAPATPPPAAAPVDTQHPTVCLKVAVPPDRGRSR